MHSLYFNFGQMDLTADSGSISFTEGRRIKEKNYGPFFFRPDRNTIKNTRSLHHQNAPSFFIWAWALKKKIYWWGMGSKGKIHLIIGWKYCNCKWNHMVNFPSIIPKDLNTNTSLDDIISSYSHLHTYKIQIKDKVWEPHWTLVIQ